MIQECQPWLGLSRINSTVSSEMLENCLRDDLKLQVNRVNAVLRPLKMIITNYPAGLTEELEVPNNNENEAMGSRMVQFGREVYIETEDFFDGTPDKGWKRLALGFEVRLMHAYFVKCNDVIRNADGSIKELHCTYDPETKSGSGFNLRKPNGNIHYVEATTAVPALFNLFQPLMVDSDADRKLEDRLNPHSWETLKGFVEASLKNTKSEEKFQFVRTGYFSADYDTSKGHLVFNRIVELKTSYK